MYLTKNTQESFCNCFRSRVAGRKGKRRHNNNCINSLVKANNLTISFDYDIAFHDTTDHEQRANVTTRSDFTRQLQITETRDYDRCATKYAQ